LHCCLTTSRKVVMSRMRAIQTASDPRTLNWSFTGTSRRLAPKVHWKAIATSRTNKTNGLFCFRVPLGSERTRSAFWQDRNSRERYRTLKQVNLVTLRGQQREGVGPTTMM